MEKIRKNMHVFMHHVQNRHVLMLSCIKHTCFHVFSPFSAYFSPMFKT